MNTINVTGGKPKIGGAIFSAPLETTLPTDAKSELDAKFKNLGYISEDGISNSNTPESEIIKAWGGDSVMVVQNSKEDNYTYTLIEATNVEVLKEIYGAENVKGDLTSGITIKANSTPLKSHCLVIDMILKNAIKRIVIPNGIVSEVGEIGYKDGEPIGYETTVQCMPDNDGNTHYEYIIKGSE